MSIGTDTLLTEAFTGANGSAPPAGWTIVQGAGSWHIQSNALTYNAGDGISAHSIRNDPTRANDNYSILWTLGSDRAEVSVKGVMLRRTNGTTTTNNCYLLGYDDTGHAVIWKLANNVATPLISTEVPAGWNGLTQIASAETVGGNVVLTISDPVDATTVTVTDSSSPYLSGDIGCYSVGNGTPDIWDTITVKGTAAGGSTATVTPAPAVITITGRTPATSAFSNVRIREVLVNESGQVVGGAANITLLVWYSGRFGGAPDVSLNGMTSDANGTTSWSIATGTLAYNDPIAYVAQDSVSFSNYTCARMIPSYE